MQPISHSLRERGPTPLAVALALAVAIVLIAAALGRANEPPPVKGGSIAPPAIRAAEPVAHSLAESSVYISVDLGNGATGGGTGTVIASENGRSLILTNAHVVESADHPISVTYWCDRRPWIQPATYLGGSSVSHLSGSLIHVNGPDLALLEVKADLQPVELATEIPATGEAVQLFGFGGADLSGTTPIRKSGRVLPEPGWIEPATKTSIQTINGDSGSGILNDRGQLVAVHWGGGAVRLDSVHSFTVSTLQRKGVFSRLKDRLAARKIAKAVAGVFAGSPSPPPVKAPAASPCPGGVCQPQMGRFGRRR